MKDDLYRKIHGNMIFPVYMYKCYGYGTTVLPKKLRWSCPEKIHLKVSLPASLKKMIFILENMVFLLKYYTDWHSRKNSRSSQVSCKKRCSVRKGVPRNFAKFTAKHLRTATLLKKRLWRKCFSVNFAKFLKAPFLQNTFVRLLLESQWFSVLLWRPL